MILGTSLGQALAGPFLASCALLVVAGAGKVAHPDPARLAARAIGLRVPRLGVVGFGIVEVAVGIAAAVFGGATAIAVAASYLFLTVVAIRLLLRSPSTPCACLGSSDAVVTRTHVLVDVTAVVVAVAVAIGPASGASPWSRLSGHWITGAVFVVLVATCVKLTTLALETLPTLTAAAKEGAT